MANTPKDILKMIEEKEIEWVDVRFTDPKGKWQHLTMVASVLGEDELTQGLMFDGSSIEGWKTINESDMILKPDLDAVYVDPFSATPMLILFCDIVEPDTGELYSRDPRSTAKRALFHRCGSPAASLRSSSSSIARRHPAISSGKRTRSGVYVMWTLSSSIAWTPSPSKR